jgi:predicted transposase/invertase (TIGR01784 family)
MRIIHEKEICPHLYALKPIIHVLAKEKNLNLLEYVLRYILDNGESENVKEVTQIFADAVSDQDEGKIMNIANGLRREGRQEGIQEGIEHVAKNMLASNMNIDVISKATKLSVAQIKSLKTTIHTTCC